MFHIFLAQFIKDMQKLAHISVIPLGYSERFCSVTLNSVYCRVFVLLLLPWALIARVTIFQTEQWIEAAVGGLCITAEVVEGRHCLSAGLCGSVTILSTESQFLWMPAKPARCWKSLKDVSRSFYHTAWSLMPFTKEQLEKRQNTFTLVSSF